MSKPYVMDLDGRHKHDVSGNGYSASPDGKLVSYHEDYQVYVSKLDGSDKQHIKTGNPFNFVPTWSPDGQWLLFLSGEHYNCHPYVVKRDGTGLRKLADRRGYTGVVETLKYPDFHSASSDVPVWSPDGNWVYYTAKIGDNVELMRVSLTGTIEQLTRSKSARSTITRRFHPMAIGFCSALTKGAPCSSTSPEPMGRMNIQLLMFHWVIARCMVIGNP